MIRMIASSFLMRPGGRSVEKNDGVLSAEATEGRSDSSPDRTSVWAAFAEPTAASRARNTTIPGVGPHLMA